VFFCWLEDQFFLLLNQFLSTDLPSAEYASSSPADLA
jgi:hypothetical protein